MILRVVAYMGSPIVTRDAIHLDAVLAAVHPTHRGRQLTRGCAPSAITYPDLPVPKLAVAGHWVYMASAASYPDGRPGRESIVKRKDQTDLHLRQGSYNPGSGPERAYCLPLPTINASRVEFFAVGRRRSVLEMLRRVTHIGSYRRHGFGRVLRWEAKDSGLLPESVLCHESLAARHLPQQWTATHDGADMGRCQPPYWHPEGSPRVRSGSLCELSKQVLAACRKLT